MKSPMAFFTEKVSNPKKPLNPQKTGFGWFVEDYDLELKISLSIFVVVMMFICALWTISPTIANCI